jgi:hypothetical protein
MNNFFKKLALLALILLINSTFKLQSIGRCECNEGCTAPVEHLKAKDPWEGGPEQLCPKGCIKHGGWTGKWTNQPTPAPFCRD